MQFNLHKVVIVAMAGLGTQALQAQVPNAREDAVICFNCTYQQAIEYAKDWAMPLPKCTNDNASSNSEASQSCDNQPRKVLVYDAIGKQGYGFRLSHHNHGMQVADRVITSDILSLLGIAADARLELQASMATLAQEVVQSPLESRAENLLRDLQAKAKSGVATASVSNCANNRDAKALTDALNDDLAMRLQRAAQLVYQAKRDSIISAFRRKHNLNSLVLDSLTFGINSGSVQIAGSFKLTEEHTGITRTYYPTGMVSTPGVYQNALGVPTVVFQLKYDHNSMRVEVDLDNSQMGGYALRRLKANSGGRNAPVLSSCLAEVMKMFFDVRLAPGGGIPQDPLPPPNSPYPGGPGGTPQCVYDVYTRGAGYSGSYRADC